MTTLSRRSMAGAVISAVALCTGATLAVPAAALSSGPAPTLLPLPAAPPNSRISVRAADVTPSGMVGGSLTISTTDPATGTVSLRTLPQRWAMLPGVGWLRQQLRLPVGATQGAVEGLSDFGEAGGRIVLDGEDRAVRWPMTGGTPTVIGGPRSTVGAVGPNGPWAVVSRTSVDGGAQRTDTDLVDRAGGRTPLHGTPELGAGWSRVALSVGSARSALVGVTSGVGQGIVQRHVLWDEGATRALPVTQSAVLPASCLSQVQPDGSLVYSGFVAGPAQVLVRHVGGVPGRDVELSRARTDASWAGLTCDGRGVRDLLAADGGIAGTRGGSGPGIRAAYWDAAGVETVVPLAAGDSSAAGVAVANGRRMVIRSQRAGVDRLSFWHDGVITDLPIPSGWRHVGVVELTDAGLLVAEVLDGTVRRPVAWDLRGR